MSPATMPRRFRRLERTAVLERRVPVARTAASRLLGLALLDRQRAGAGLLIPGCRSVHTFGMRFPLDLVFLDGQRRPLEIRCRVARRRVVTVRGARSVLELPVRESCR